MSNEKTFAETSKKLSGYVNPAVKGNTPVTKPVPVAKSSEKVAIKKVSLETNIPGVVITNHLIGAGKTVFTGDVPMAFKSDVDEIVNEIQEKSKVPDFQMKIGSDGLVSLNDFAKFHGVDAKKLYNLAYSKNIKLILNGKDGFSAQHHLLEKLDLTPLQMAEDVKKTVFGNQGKQTPAFRTFYIRDRK